MNISSNCGKRPQGPVAQLIAALVALVMLVAGVMFSVVFLAVLAVAGMLLWGYFWWKTRALRKVMREHMEAMQAQSFAAPPPASGGESDVIEGESVRVADEKDRLR